MKAVSIKGAHLSGRACSEVGGVTEHTPCGRRLNHWLKRSVESWAKQSVFTLLGHISVGYLSIEDNGVIYTFGQPSSSLQAHIVVDDNMTYKDIIFNGLVGAGEAYMKGAWSSSDMLSVVRVMCANLETIQQANGVWSSVRQGCASFIHRYWRVNSKANARLNIAAHYDLGNDFFALFLDPLMMYSAAIYPKAPSTQKNTTTLPQLDGQCTLDTAAVYKLEHICQRLQLKDSDHLLEIGSGWGGMAIYAAKHYGCRVTTTTISQAQYQYAVNAVKEAKLESKVTVLMSDYRDLEGHFDKLVSIEMIEAVGQQYYRQYFNTCSRLLKPNGLMLIQAITVPDQRYEKTKASTDFIQRYIFPGGELPSLLVITDNVRRYTNMQIVGVDDMTVDYAQTLADWRSRFFDNIDQVKAQGFNDVFIRMWDFYLVYCEGGFRERTISTVQVVMAKPRCLSLPAIAHSV